MSQAKLQTLEEDYWHEPPFLRRKLLIEINELRVQLGMPLVDASLRPLDTDEVLGPQIEEEDITPDEEDKLDEEDRLDILNQIHKLLLSLDLSDTGYRMRMREYTDSQVKYDTVRTERELTDEQLLDLLAGLENEYSEVTESRYLRDNYIYNSQPPGYPTHLITDPRYVCHRCGRPFPTEAPPRSPDTPGTYRGWLPHEVPWIRGGLTMDIDEKGVTRIFHGYPDTGCYATYAREREESDG